jgi:hypothetical protein
MQTTKTKTRVKHANQLIQSLKKKIFRDKHQMPIIKSNHKDLFRTPTTKDKINLVQLLLDVHELSVNLSLSLLKIIHRELINNQSRNHSLFKRYAEAIESLRYHNLDMFQLVVAAWKFHRSPSSTPTEWFPEDKPNNQDGRNGT